MDSDMRKELKYSVLDKVETAITTIRSSKHVDQVICALQSVAVLLFRIDPAFVPGVVVDCCRDKAYNCETAGLWRDAFYAGAAFRVFANVLLLDVASNWLNCFSVSATKHIHDIFFTNGPCIEVINVLIPYLQQKETESLNKQAVISNVQRLLSLCLIENTGVLKIARELNYLYKSQNFSVLQLHDEIGSLSQLIASIPDKAQKIAPVSLSRHLFFKQVVTQLLAVAKEMNKGGSNKDILLTESGADVMLAFTAELFSRISRRGSADTLVEVMVPQLIQHIKKVSPDIREATPTILETSSESLFWSRIIHALNDSHAMEWISEHILHKLVVENINDADAYWVLWMSFDLAIKEKPFVRSMFINKFLMQKVFPVRCLRWILQFAVFECVPLENHLTRGKGPDSLLDIVQVLTLLWCKKEFVQSTPIEQQAYVTAAIGLGMEKLTKEELDRSRDVMQSVLQGVSCRLESPTDLVRKMASAIALVFSKIIDPGNPLYLDDSCKGDEIDWEFGSRKPCGAKVKHEGPTLSVVSADAVVNPPTIHYGLNLSEEGRGDARDTSRDTSLEPYDLTDDDTDLKKKPTQLIDVLGALRKSDDIDGVERAIDVAEKLVRASPDELICVATDLVRALVHVRCSDTAAEDEEYTTEEKRQRALVSLLVTRPFEAVDTINGLLYSPTVSMSQRVMILDVMTEAAQELACTKHYKHKHQPEAGAPLISDVSRPRPWFLPVSRGPVGVRPWRDVSESRSPLNYSIRYERELPLKQGDVRKGKSIRESFKSLNLEGNLPEDVQNKFPLYAASFMLPSIQSFDKKRHGVDLLGRDFIVLGKLVYMLGVCMRCVSLHPEASALAPPLLDMLRRRDVCNHKEAYVRKATLFTASCILRSIHPSYVASCLSDGNLEIISGLDWIRTWALGVSDSDVDNECQMLAVSCLKLHSEMALQASRVLDSPESKPKMKNIDLPFQLSTIKIPSIGMKY